jgi:hypothetical protein
VARDVYFFGLDGGGGGRGTCFWAREIRERLCLKISNPSSSPPLQEALELFDGVAIGTAGDVVADGAFEAFGG